MREVLVENPWLERLKKEKDELNEKWSKLNKFIKSEDFKKLDVEDMILLRLQENYMCHYLCVLDDRIDLHKYK